MELTVIIGAEMKVPRTVPGGAGIMGKVVFIAHYDRHTGQCDNHTHLCLLRTDAQ